MALPGSRFESSRQTQDHPGRATGAVDHHGEVGGALDHLLDTFRLLAVPTRPGQQVSPSIGSAGPAAEVGEVIRIAVDELREKYRSLLIGGTNNTSGSARRSAPSIEYGVSEFGV